MTLPSGFAFSVEIMTYEAAKLFAENMGLRLANDSEGLHAYQLYLKNELHVKPEIPYWLSDEKRFSARVQYFDDGFQDYNWKGSLRYALMVRT